MDNIYEISLLLDFYGQLITTRQFEILDLHYNDDLSLGEIAEQLNISRQGVFDNIKRGKDILEEFENKLGLVRIYFEQKRKSEEIVELLNSLQIEAMEEEDKTKLKMIENGIRDIINRI